MVGSDFVKDHPPSQTNGGGGSTGETLKAHWGVSGGPAQAVFQ